MRGQIGKEKQNDSPMVEGVVCIFSTQTYCFVGEQRQDSVMTQREKGEVFSFLTTKPNGKQCSHKLDPPVETLTSWSLT